MRVCLNMIVRDESAIIERCLRSVAPHVACWVICDTGSSDDTVARIERLFADAGVPGEIHEIVFENFSQARNEALERCRRSAHGFDVILLIDADMELVVEHPRWRESITAPAHLVRQTTADGFAYWNLRLLSRQVDARYVGATHEYISVHTPAERLEGVHMLDHACGSSRGVKHERDLTLLTHALEHDPSDARSAFYLAQTLREMGRHSEAVLMYERRIALGGWDEEVWYSRFMVARCHAALGDSARFAAHCLEAYNLRPTRAEPLHALAEHYRNGGRHEACAMLCETGLSLPVPNDLLFVDEAVYRTGFRQTMSISGWYSTLPERKARARALCAELTVEREAPPAVRTLARSNWRHYASSLETLLGPVRFTPLTVPLPEGYHPCNPSLTVRDGEIWGNVRGVNYIEDNGRYITSNGIIRSTNRLVRLDAQLQPTHVTAITDDSPYSADTPEAPNVVGLEDVRLFAQDGRLRASCVVVDRDREFRRRIAVLDLADDGRVEQLTTQRHEDHLHQKNWMPFVDDHGVGFVYMTDPTVIVRWNNETRQCVAWRRHECSAALEHQRGSSGLVPFDKGWLCVTHEVSYATQSAGSRVYLHRFVQLDAAFRVRAVTEPFWLRRLGVEFCAGLVTGPATGLEADTLLMAFGVYDREAWLAVITADAVRRALRPLKRTRARR